MHSIERRIMLVVLVIIPLLWLVSVAAAWHLARRQVDEVYDTQLTLMARQLLRTGLAAPAGPYLDLPATSRLIGDGDEGRDDGTEFGLALWDASGRALLVDGNGAAFVHGPRPRGFQRIALANGEHWRVFFLPALDGRRLAAVGQSESERRELVWNMVSAQLLLWLLPLPLLLLTLRFGVRGALAPLRRIAAGLAQRRPDDATPIDVEAPLEVRPLIVALNALFPRVAETLERERRFTADAAHELRTPLAALQVQAEVAQLSSGERRDHAHGMLLQGIGRATRLVEQLLSLSRLDPMSLPVTAGRVDWQRVVGRALGEVETLALERRVRLECMWRVDADRVLPLTGDEALLVLMLRNLLDNALRYGAADSVVTLILERAHIDILDQGPGIDPAWIGRVGERFVRPPGQSEPGSGLGLSIVMRIAALHGLCLSLGNHPAAGLCARLEHMEGGA